MGFEEGSILPALTAALLWAISAPVINLGLRALPADRTLAIATGLAISLLTGSISLLVLSGFRLDFADFSPAVLAAGILTFPVGTGLYYVSGHVAAARMEVAAQYSNAKPAISVVLAYVFIGEAISGSDLASLGMILTGVAIMIGAALRKDPSARAIGAGLLLAAAWAGGEFFVRIATFDRPALEVTLGALTSATILYLAGYAALVALKGQGGRVRSLLRSPGMAAFALHGVLSFGLAYLFFFRSIQTLGMIDTIAITAFWPALAFVFGVTLTRVLGRPYPISKTALAAFAAFVIGSLTYVYF